MSKITYTDKVALNQNPNVQDINKVNATDMNEIKNVVNSNETKVLLAVTDTAPAQCSTGDMYYDTTDDLIYTATGTNTWSSTGVAPTENTLYVVLTTQTAYAYDGDNETLVSVGSASGSVVNNYSTSTIEGYSCNYVNGAISGAIVSTYTNNQTSAYSTEYVNGIVESGSNTNGNWIKYIDGTMICYNTISLNNIAVNTANGSMYISSTQTLGSFPQTFTSTPKVTITPHAEAFGWVAQQDQASTTSVGRITMCRSTSSSSSSYEIDYIAIGRWKQ